MKRAGFTMIELIFVIVILGILAAVAVPKLAATRDDAKIAAEVTTVSQAIQNLGAEYTAQGAFTNYTVAEAEAATKCVTIAQVANTPGSVSVTIVANTVTACGDATFIGLVQGRLGNNGSLQTDGTAKTFAFGGTSIVL